VCRPRVLSPGRVRRSLQDQAATQCAVPRVAGLEQAAALQFQDEPVEHFFRRAGEVGGPDVQAITGSPGEPVFHDVVVAGGAGDHAIAIADGHAALLGEAGELSVSALQGVAGGGAGGSRGRGGEVSEGFSEHAEAEAWVGEELEVIKPGSLLKLCGVSAIHRRSSRGEADRNPVGRRLLPQAPKVLNFL
jgi:hypothetical protein